MDDRLKGRYCIAGCKVYGNLNSGELERYHHKDCPNYPESLSEVMDKMAAEIREYKIEKGKKT